MRIDNAMAGVSSYNSHKEKSIKFRISSSKNVEGKVETDSSALTDTHERLITTMAYQIDAEVPLSRVSPLPLPFLDSYARNPFPTLQRGAAMSPSRCSSDRWS